MILLYGNYLKHEEIFLHALAGSFSGFGHLLTLLLPYAISMGLPLGYSVALVLLLGKWQEDREILALRSLGVSFSHLHVVLLAFSLFVSGFSLFSWTYLSPSMRTEFENTKSTILWENISQTIQNRGEISFDLSKQARNQSLGGLSILGNEDLSHVVLSVSDANSTEWKNLRMVLYESENKGVSAIIHSKRAGIHLNENHTELSLILQEVDVEQGTSKLNDQQKGSHFLSFQKWKQPLVFQLGDQAKSRKLKQFKFSELWAIIHENNDPDKVVKTKELMSKYLSMGTSPFFMTILIIPLAMRFGKKDMTICICGGIALSIVYFAIAVLMVVLLERTGLSFLGWGVPSLICTSVGFWNLYRKRDVLV